MTFLNNTGLERLWSKITAKLDLKVDKVKVYQRMIIQLLKKNKLAGIATGATKTVVDTALSSSSTNPVQNKVVNTAISNLNTLVGDTAVSTQITNAVANKVDKVSGKGLSTNDYTTAEKNKLSGIDTGANKTIVDNVLSTTSTNPVQNKVVNTAISNLNTLVGDKSVSSQISTAIASKADTGHTHTKSEVGLGNVDNTADADKSVKYATSAGSAASVTGVVNIEHGGTGATSRTEALTALLAGGSGATDANIVASGTYVLTTETASNLPPKPGYYLLSVFRYDIYDLACGQIAIHLSDGTLYSRDYVGGNWKEWVCCSSKQIDTISIPNGANLNDYRSKGFYASHLVGNSIANLPSDLGNGAFELVVTGIGQDGVYCTQWLKSFETNKLWVRTQVDWQEPWSWTNWEQIPVKNEVLTKDSEGIELGTKATVDHGGYIDFHFHGSEEDYTSRIIESGKGRLSAISDLDVSGWLQCSNGFWIAGGGLYASNNNYMVYGTALPSAGTKGRIFFKKV